MAGSALRVCPVDGDSQIFGVGEIGEWNKDLPRRDDGCGEPIRRFASQNGVLVENRLTGRTFRGVRHDV